MEIFLLRAFNPSLLLLSIIIVNYNVKHFLEQCLYSVKKAIEGMEAEVIVIDNNSSDNSLGFLRPAFPWVKFMGNKENIGFARACNQGLAMCSGQYILFLNPDTLLPEDSLRLTVKFLDENKEAGAAGIKMVDGKGKFLKESKRAFPSPLTSLFKLFGLARMFPTSKLFSKYHLGHLESDKTHEVDVLAGAYMMIKRDVLDQTGGFDEIFFMYGEDVDLSYRIQKAGFRNYYLDSPAIIHFKGESTRKGSMNYVRMFYKAMSIFVRKHYGGSKAGLFIFLIHMAIWIRALLTAVVGFIRKVGLPVIDAGLMILSFWIVKNFWNEYVRTDIRYSTRLLWIVFPALTVFYLLTAYYAGLYDRYYRRASIVRSTLFATVVLLAVYSLLPEQYRFSRGIILFGALLSLLLIGLLRWLLIATGVLSGRVKKEHPGTLVVGSPQEFDEASRVLKNAGLDEILLGRLSVKEGDNGAIGPYQRLKELRSRVPYNEIIFCEGSLSFAEIINTFPLVPENTSIKFHASGSSSLVGSDSKDSSGVYVSSENGFNLSDPYIRRIKRLIDVVSSVFFLISFPVHLFTVKNAGNFFINCFKVLFGKKSWVGYGSDEKRFPSIRPGIIGPNGIPVIRGSQLPVESLQALDYWYAKEYEPITDLRILWKSYPQLGAGKRDGKPA